MAGAREPLICFGELGAAIGTTRATNNQKTVVDVGKHPFEGKFLDGFIGKPKGTYTFPWVAFYGNRWSW